MNLFWSVIYSAGILFVGFVWESAVQKSENEETIHFLLGLIETMRGEQN